IRTGLKKSELARRAIQQFIESFDAQDFENRPAVKAKDLLGIAQSGVPDLGAEHKRHLARKMRGNNA
ncbi:MAG: hypothetical protein R6Y91_09550, partial [Desulfohalobium sp.]